MSTKVSIIVPVYNAEKTLANCLGNLVNQTLAEIEIILINDASTDKSLTILKDCEHAYPQKILLIDSEKNLGPGGARNIGLSYASGEYIGFVDSDDVADTQMYEKLYHTAISGHYDMVDGAFYYEEQDSLMLYTADNCIGDLDDKKRSILISGAGYLWSRIFHHDLFQNILFRENTILEDLDVLLRLFMNSKRVGSIKDVIYKYCCYPSSASKPTDPFFYHKAVIDAIHAVYNSLHTYSDYSVIQSAVEYTIIHLYHAGIVNLVHPSSNLASLDRTHMLNELRELRFTYVMKAFSQNPFILQKITENDLDLISKIDQLNLK
jgi:glycosyltransferase involved in cell wall biosynthesis